MDQHEEVRLRVPSPSIVILITVLSMRRAAPLTAGMCHARSDRIVKMKKIAYWGAYPQIGLAQKRSQSS